MSVIGVIPARLDSERFPRKILTPINGKPMVMCVAERAMNASLLDEVIIAVDSEEVYKELNKFNVKVVMTTKDHLSGSDRIAEVVENRDVDIVVNIQGDEPEINPNLIDQIISLFNDKNTMMATAATTDLTLEDLNDENIVKVKINDSKHAIEFSRNPIFGDRVFRHIGIYAFKKKMLENFTKLSQTKNEIDQAVKDSKTADFPTEKDLLTDVYLKY